MNKLTLHRLKRTTAVILVFYCVVLQISISVSSGQQQQMGTGTGQMSQQMGQMSQQMGSGIGQMSQQTGSGSRQMSQQTGNGIDQMVQKPGFQEKDVQKLGQDGVVREQTWKGENGTTYHQLIWLDKDSKIVGQQSWVVGKDGNVIGQQQQMGNGTDQMFLKPDFQEKDVQKLGQDGVVREQTWQGENGITNHQLFWLDKDGKIVGQQSWVVGKDGNVIGQQQQSSL